MAHNTASIVATPDFGDQIGTDGDKNARLGEQTPQSSFQVTNCVLRSYKWRLANAYFLLAQVQSEMDDSGPRDVNSANPAKRPRNIRSCDLCGRRHYSKTPCFGAPRAGNLLEIGSTASSSSVVPQLPSLGPEIAMILGYETF